MSFKDSRKFNKNPLGKSPFHPWKDSKTDSFFK